MNAFVRVAWWVLLVTLAALLGWGAQTLGIPGGWFVAAVVVGLGAGLVRPRAPRVARPVLAVPQAVVGVLVGASIRPEALPDLIRFFPAILGVLVITVAFSTVAGIVLARFGPLSRETATLGTLPGGASAMTVLSVEAGADTAVVALMQYLRLVLVVGTSAAVAAFLAPHGAPGHASTGLGFAVPDGFTLVLTPALAVVGVVLGRLVRLPTAALLGPMILCLTVSALGWAHPVWFPGVAQAAYIILGLYVGQLFDRASLVQARKLLPPPGGQHPRPSRLLCPGGPGFRGPRRGFPAHRLPGHQPRGRRYHRHHRPGFRGRSFSGVHHPDVPCPRHPFLRAVSSPGHPQVHRSSP